MRPLGVDSVVQHQLASVRGRLVAIIIGLTLLLTSASIALLAYAAHQNREEANARLADAARAVSAVADRELGRSAAMVEALAQDPELAAGKWPAFHARAARIYRHMPGRIVVSDMSGRIVLDGRAEYGAAVPPIAFTAQARSQLVAGRVATWMSAHAGEPGAIAVSARVPGDPGQLVLSYLLPSRALASELQDVNLPTGAIASVLDPDARVTARTQDGGPRMGALAPPDLRAALRRGSSGLVRGETLEGVPALGAYHRSSATGWTAVVVVSRAASSASTLRVVLFVGLIYLALFGVSVGLVFALSRRIGREMGALVTHAESLRHGQPVRGAREELQEVREVRAAIEHASQELATRETNRVMMMNELNHRVKNSLATVQSLARQSFRRENPSALEIFEGKLLALAEAHDLLSRSDWTSADLSDIATAALRPQLARIDLMGDRVTLLGQAPVSLAMVLHELMTNSAKYGALSEPDGRVSLAWTTQGTEVVLRWSRSGGPPVSPPAKAGFGTRLIRGIVQSELRGSIRIDYNRTGLVAELVLPPNSTSRWTTSF